MGLNIQIQGVKEAVAALQSLVPSLRIRTMRIALNAACGVIKDKVVATAPRDSGLLAKSQRVKVAIPQASRNPAHHDKPAWGLVGAGRGIVGFQKRRKSGKFGAISARTMSAAVKAVNKAGVGARIQTASERSRFSASREIKDYARRASRYSHFAEKGRMGKGGTHFMEQAANSSGAAATAKFAEEIKEGIAAVAHELYLKQKQSVGKGTSITVGGKSIFIGA